MKRIILYLLAALMLSVGCSGCFGQQGENVAAKVDTEKEFKNLTRYDEETHLIGESVKMANATVKLSDVKVKKESDFNVCTVLLDVTNQSDRETEFDVALDMYRSKDGVLIDNIEELREVEAIRSNPTRKESVEAGKTEQLRLNLTPPANIKCFYLEVTVNTEDESLVTGYFVVLQKEEATQDSQPDITDEGSKKQFHLAVGDTEEERECKIKLASVTKKKLADGDKARYTFRFDVTNKSHSDMMVTVVGRIILWDSEGTSSLYNRQLFKSAGNNITADNIDVQSGQTVSYEFYADGPLQYDDPVNVELCTGFEWYHNELVGALSISPGFNVKLP